MSELMKIHVQIAENRCEIVDACKVEIADDDILVLYDSEGGIRARFRRWEYYVRAEAS